MLRKQLRLSVVSFLQTKIILYILIQRVFLRGFREILYPDNEEDDRTMNCFSCCMSEEKISSRRSNSDVNELGNLSKTKSMFSFANISFKSDASRKRYINEEIVKKGKGDTNAKTFDYTDLCTATNNFSPDNQLGEGGFGRVYKGQIDNPDQVVAVKQLDRTGYQGNREFLVEVWMLSLLNHPNLVSLVGYCVDGEQRILVYEYMPNGSLESHLLDLPSDKKPLDWDTRIKVSIGAARGLEYLHETADPPVIYRDFKTSNILLDQDFNPKLSDFGLAKIGPTGEKVHVSTRVMGTYGYCAPEYALTGQLTVKSDVYSFGVVFLEIITGKRVIDNSRPADEQNLVTWATPLLKDKRSFSELADPLLQGDYPNKSLHKALAVAAMCLQDDVDARPVMGDVVNALEYITTGKGPEAEHGDGDGGEQEQERKREDDEEQEQQEKSKEE